jgi:hypothetical protein
VDARDKRGHDEERRVAPRSGNEIRKDQRLKRKRKLTTEELKRQEEKQPRRDEATERKAHDFLRFWMVCREGQCRRAQRCTGKLRPCFERHWPLVPEPIKVSFRAMIKAYAQGASPEEAARIGDEAEAKEIAMMRAAEGASA